MLNPASSSQEQGSPDGGIQGRPVTPAESPGQPAGVHRDAAARPSDRPEDIAREAVSAGGRPYRLIPTDPGDALY